MWIRALTPPALGSTMRRNVWLRKFWSAPGIKGCRAVAQVPIQISPRCLASALEGAAVVSDTKTASADMKSIVLCGEPKRPEVRMRNRFISDRRDMQPEDFGRRIGRCQQLWAE